MKIKRFLALAAIFGVLSTFSCSPKLIPDDDTQKTEEPDTPSTPENPDTPPTPEAPKVPESISILAIGNSFSVDAMQYLYDILKEAGVKTIDLGNLYIGGCTLATHDGNLSSNSAAYTFYRNTSGEWTSTASYKPLDALSLREWDYVSMQQASGNSGQANTYEPYLTNIINVVKEKCPKAKMMWHMTWAYQGNSSHSSFPNYGSNQMTMYNAILSAVKEKVLPHSEIGFVIPCGTAVQNLRTSVYGDKITRDGYHMSYDAGRFVTALTWANKITGCDLSKISFRPAGYTYTETQVAAIKEAAVKAVEKPFEITESSYPPDPNDVTPGTFEEIIAKAGHNIADYEAVPITYTDFAYYNSANTSMYATQYNHTTSTASNLDNFVCTQIFTKEDLPNGCLIVLLDGYQYRPEGWVNMQKNTSATRPAEFSGAIAEVNDAWWGSWTHRAFNLAKSGKPKLTEATAKEVREAFAIYRPKK